MTTHYYLNENFIFLQFSNSTNYLVKKSVSDLLPCSISYMESVGDAQPFFKILFLFFIVVPLRLDMRFKNNLPVKFQIFAEEGHTEG